MWMLRLLMLGLCFALSSSCVMIHTVDFVSRRSSLGARCEVPMNRGGDVPAGWQEIGFVTIQWADDWTEQQLADELRAQACEMGAEYVIVSGRGQFVRGAFLARASQQ